MRYLSPAYLPLLVIGVYALKHAGLDGDGVGEALRTLFWLAVIDLPLIFIILQVVAGNNPGEQVALVTTLTSVFLAGAAALYAAVLARRASPRLLAYVVPVLMLFSLADKRTENTACHNYLKRQGSISNPKYPDLAQRGRHHPASSASAFGGRRPRPDMKRGMAIPHSIFSRCRGESMPR